MRFMLIVKASKDSEAGKMPSMELLQAMGRFNEEMMKAGVMVFGDGLKPSSAGARIQFQPGAKPTVIDGPFAETKELIAGFWVIETKSREEAIEWAKRSPAPHGPDQYSEIEVRPFFSPEDFGPEVAAQEKQMREELERKLR